MEFSFTVCGIALLAPGENDSRTIGEVTLADKGESTKPIYKNSFTILSTNHSKPNFHGADDEYT